jgi:hypothetical protein
MVVISVVFIISFSKQLFSKIKLTLWLTVLPQAETKGANIFHVLPLASA